MVGFIDRQRDEFDVESICRVLPIASSTYYAAKQREIPASVRSRQDAAMMHVSMELPRIVGQHLLWADPRCRTDQNGRSATLRYRS
jgi:putative transposase